MKLVQWMSCSIAAGVAMFLVGVMCHFSIPFIAPGIQSQYEHSGLFRPWSGGTSTYMTLHPFLYAPVFTAIFLKLHGSKCFPSGMRGGLIYGTGVFCVGSLPVFVLAFASFQVSCEIIGSWIMQNLCQYLTAGVVIGIALPKPSEIVVNKPVSRRNSRLSSSQTRARDSMFL